MTSIIDDNDPNLYFGGAPWQANTVNNADPAARIDRYFGKTMHGSTTSGDFMEVEWEGSDIAVYGSRRDNHGIYGISVDSAPLQYFSGLNFDNVFQQVLYATSGLQPGIHRLKVVNSHERNPPPQAKYVWLDIDFVAMNGTLRNANPGAAQVKAATPPKPSSSSDGVILVESVSPASPTLDLTTTRVSTSLMSSSSSAGSVELLSSATLSSTMSVYPSSSTSSQSISLPNSSVGAFSASGGSFSSPVYSSISVAVSSALPLPTGPNIPLSPGQVDDGPARDNTTLIAAVTTSAIVITIIAIVLGILWARRRAKRQLLEEYEDADYFEEIISSDNSLHHQARQSTVRSWTNGFRPYSEHQEKEASANYSRTSRSTSWARGYFSPLW